MATLTASVDAMIIGNVRTRTVPDLPTREGSPAAILPYLVEQLEKTRPRFPASLIELFMLCDDFLSHLQGFGPVVSYRDAARALFNRLNELQIAPHRPHDDGPIATAQGEVLRKLFEYVASTVNLGHVWFRGSYLREMWET